MKSARRTMAGAGCVGCRRILRKTHFLLALEMPFPSSGSRNPNRRMESSIRKFLASSGAFCLTPSPLSAENVPPTQATEAERGGETQGGGGGPAGPPPPQPPTPPPPPPPHTKTPP